MYRVADADRDRGLALLRRCYAEGRLTVEELAERAERLTHARTTSELRAGLRDLPSGTALSTVTPRLAGLRDSPLGAAVAYRATRLAVAWALFTFWLFTSLVLLVALGVVKLVADASSTVEAGFALAWIAMTWLTWRAWRRGGRRSRRR